MRFQKIMLLAVIFLAGCNQEKSEWAEAKAVISNVEQIEGMTTPSYGYTISYDASESTATDNEGKAIKGPIEQHGMLDKKPINSQKLKLRYRRDEPVMFELLEEMKFE